MTGKLFSNILCIIVFVNAVAASATQMFTDLSTAYPGLHRYAVISVAVSAFLAPFLPRIQKLGDNLRESQVNT